MIKRFIHWFREPLVVMASAFAAATSLAAANAAYLRHVSSYPGDLDPVLVLVSKFPIWLATLNKPLLPLAAQLLQDPKIEDWIRVMTTLGAFFGVGAGTLAGIYLLLWTYGKAVTRSGDAFGWAAARALKWVCISICGVYLLISLWYLVQVRDFLEVGILGKVIGIAAGFFSLATLEFGLLAFGGYHCYLAGKEWLRTRGMKKW